MKNRMHRLAMIGLMAAAVALGVACNNSTGGGATTAPGGASAAPGASAPASQGTKPGY
jgi:hypothetical protein